VARNNERTKKREARGLELEQYGLLHQTRQARGMRMRPTSSNTIVASVVFVYLTVIRCVKSRV
jgi:hypothetical protein